MSDAIEYLNPSRLAAPIGMYSQVSRSSGMPLVFVAGQVAMSGDGVFIGRADFAAQLAQVLENIQLALQGAGATWASVLRLTTYLVNLDDFAKFRAIRSSYFEKVLGTGPYPPHTLLVVQALSAPEHLVEMDCIASVAPTHDG